MDRHENMSHIRGKNTTPEMKVRKRLFAEGFRFRVNVRKMYGSPDIVLAKYRTCIFVNGCFWHGHDGCSKYTRPRTNPEFWKEKVLRNKQRDEVVTAKLESAGWSVVTIWECELSKDRIDATMESLCSTLLLNRNKWLQDVEKRKADKLTAKLNKAAEKAQKEALMAGFDIPRKIVKLSAEEQ